MDDATLTKTICAALGRIPGWIWSETAEYPADKVGIYYGAIPDEPDRAVGVRMYSIPVDDENTERIRRVQARIRGARHDRADADRLATITRAVLVDMLPPPGISEILFYSTGDLGSDNNQRELRTENFTVSLDNQESL